MKTLLEIISYREMIYSLVKQELRGKYKGSVLGFIWTFLNPLFQLIVYTFVFSIIMKSSIDDYYLFLFVAFIPWLFFSNSVSGGARAVMDKKELVKKVYFRRQALPISYVTSAFVNMILSFVIVFGALLFSGRGIEPLLLCYLPMVMLIEYILALGITMLTCAVTVYFRDLEYIMAIITSAWMYLTPIMYSSDMVPEEYIGIFDLNPVTPIIEGYRNILYYQTPPDWMRMFESFLVAVVFLGIGNLVFGLIQKKFAEEL